MSKSAPDRDTRPKCHETLIRPRDLIRDGLVPARGRHIIRWCLPCPAWSMCRIVPCVC